MEEHPVGAVAGTFEIDVAGDLGERDAEEGEETGEWKRPGGEQYPS